MHRRRSATAPHTAASACRCRTRNGSSSASPSGRPWSFSRQLYAEPRQQDDEPDDHGHAAPQDPRMAGFAHRGHERAAEQDHHPQHEPRTDHQRRRQDDDPLPGRCVRQRVHYHEIVPDALPLPDANYSSGNDYIVEFLGYRFAFSATDFEGRVIAAAVKLGVVPSPELDEDETADLVALAASGV